MIALYKLWLIDNVKNKTKLVDKLKFDRFIAYQQQF